jgi:hypothetical protein
MQYARNFMKRIGVIMSIIFSLSLGQLCAQFETTAERIQVESLSFRQYNVGGTGTSGMFYYHTFSTESMEGSRWVGAYGGRMRPYVVDNPESKKYMNRFRTMAITKQLCLGVTLPIIGYIAYDSFTNDTPITDHIGLMLAASVPITVAILIPYGKKRSLSKAAEAFNKTVLE